MTTITMQAVAAGLVARIELGLPVPNAPTTRNGNGPWSAPSSKGPWHAAEFVL